MKNLKNLLPAFRSTARSPASADSGGGVAETIRRALASAGIDSQSGAFKEVGRTIEKALTSAGIRKAPVDQTAWRGPAIDVEAREIRVPDEVPAKPVSPAKPAKPARPAAVPVPGRGGEFTTHSFSNSAGTRSYKLYVPASYAVRGRERVPLIVMLHGCTQSPDDFAAGTQMNSLADKHGFLVAYPAQAANANGSRCWNWFRREDQARDAGEPSLIAGITREVAGNYNVDPRRIYVAGLSAGASMAVILGATYPDLYAAVGAHSGLPYAAAHDMGSAFAAMQSGAPSTAHARPMQGPAAADRAATPPTVPTIVFHGDRDQTVAARNGAQIVEQATAGARLRVRIEEGGSPDRRYSRTVHVDPADRHLVEHWVISGAGHTWSGGNPRGSYTDSGGPDASAEMVRFFLAQQRAGSA